MIYSSEKISDRFFEINHCDVLDLKTHDYHTLREGGRVDYYVMYILRGACTVIENGEKIRANGGSLILYLPGERQEYCFCGKDETVYAYALILFNLIRINRTRINLYGYFCIFFNGKAFLG